MSNTRHVCVDWRGTPVSLAECFDHPRWNVMWLGPERWGAFAPHKFIAAFVSSDWEEVFDWAYKSAVLQGILTEGP